MHTTQTHTQIHTYHTNTPVPYKQTQRLYTKTYQIHIHTQHTQTPTKRNKTDDAWLLSVHTVKRLARILHETMNTERITHHHNSQQMPIEFIHVIITPELERIVGIANLLEFKKTHLVNVTLKGFRS